MTYICPNCLLTFDAPKQWTEPHGEPATGCPQCYSGGYEEAAPCDECGEYITLTEYRRQKGLCEYCYKEKEN